MPSSGAGCAPTPVKVLQYARCRCCHNVTLFLAVVMLLFSGCSVMRPDKGAPVYGHLSAAATSAERAAERSTVRVRNLGCNAVVVGSGVITAQRQLLTNAHVIAGADKLEVNLWDGTTVDARVVGASVAQDLATVEVADDLASGGRASVATFAAADAPVGASLLVFGFPEGGRFTVSRGHLVAYEAIGDQRSMVLSNKVEHGNSGGPVFGENAQVVGIVRAMFADSGDAIAIPVSAAHQLLEAGAAAGPVPGCSAF